MNSVIYNPQKKNFINLSNKLGIKILKKYITHSLYGGSNVQLKFLPVLKFVIDENIIKNKTLISNIVPLFSPDLNSEINDILLVIKKNQEKIKIVQLKETDLKTQIKNLQSTLTNDLAINVTQGNITQKQAEDMMPKKHKNSIIDTKKKLSQLKKDFMIEFKEVLLKKKKIIIKIKFFINSQIPLLIKKFKKNILLLNKTNQEKLKIVKLNEIDLKNQIKNLQSTLTNDLAINVTQGNITQKQAEDMMPKKHKNSIIDTKKKLSQLKKDFKDQFYKNKKKINILKIDIENLQIYKLFSIQSTKPSVIPSPKPSVIQPTNKINCAFLTNGKKRNKGPNARSCKSKGGEGCCLEKPYNIFCKWEKAQGCIPKSGKKKYLKLDRRTTVLGRSMKFINNKIKECNENYKLYSIETGGGGDCLYHSITKGIDLLKKKGINVYNPNIFGWPNAEALRRPKKPRDVITMKDISIASALNINNEFIKPNGIKDFLNKYVQFLNEEFNEQWGDNWSPKEYIDNHFNLNWLERGITLNTVKQIGNKIIVKYNKTEWVPTDFYTINSSKIKKNLAYKFIYKAPSKSSKQIMEFHPGRKVKIYKTIGNWVSINKKNTEWVYGDVLNRHEDLKSINRTKKIDLNIINELKDYYQTQIIKDGNNHWGTMQDIVNISTVLNIGIIIFNSRKPGLYCITYPQQKTFNHYILIYNLDRTHYTLASLEGPNASEYNEVFSCADLPIWLKKFINERCANKIYCK